MPTASKSFDARVPIVIGITGHRDLVEDQLEGLQSATGHLFRQLAQQFPHTPLRVMTSLAEGADRLVARVALEAGITVQAVLPMAADSYRRDFSSDASQAEFDELCGRCEVIRMPMSEAERGAVDESSSARDKAYADAGVFISAHCHILLALWDGQDSEKLGGTAQIVYFQHYDRLPGFSESVPRTSLFLTDDESDLVYHVHCCRRGDTARNCDTTGKPVAEWFTADTDSPRTTELPERYLLMFDRTNEFNRDIVRWQERGLPVRDNIGDPPATGSERAARVVSGYFRVADALADHFQRRVSRSLALIYVLAVLTGLAFILYSEVSGFETMIFAFLALLLTGILVAGVASKHEWHRKYLEYRVLAEGLRVQFYWTVAGIHGGGQTKFAYDNFLRQRDMQLGWIRNVMRVAGAPGDANDSAVDVVGLAYAVDQWIGLPDGSGQLGYYRRKAARRHRSNLTTDRLTALCLWSGIAVASTLAFFAMDASEIVKDRLIIAMGILPLIAGVAEAYTQRKANRELSKQYQFMERVFSNARRRIDEARDDRERREVLLGLGEAALTEHAEWVLTHREREPGSAQL